jgi:16S rRNA C967 or C1407 C5-methylase (RsmB/RsmF family)
MKEQYQIKPEFERRLRDIFGNESDFLKFEKIIRTETPDSIRCNTLKISPEELKKRLEKKRMENKTAI